jgi:hypothetical protein
VTDKLLNDLSAFLPLILPVCELEIHGDMCSDRETIGLTCNTHNLFLLICRMVDLPEDLALIFPPPKLT